MAKAAALKPIERPAVDRSLTRSAYMGSVSRVKDLLEPVAPGSKPADITEKDLYGCTALTWASRNGHVDVLKYLMSRDGDCESESFGGFKPVHHACNWLRDGPVKEIIASGTSVLSTDETGSTGLHYAAARGGLSIVQQLLDAGARPDEKNLAGATALHRAANNGHLTIVQALVREGASVNEVDESGNTALHVASAAGFEAIVKFLMSQGARQVANRLGKTPLDVASTAAVKAELQRE